MGGQADGSARLRPLFGNSADSADFSMISLCSLIASSNVILCATRRDIGATRRTKGVLWHDGIGDVDDEEEEELVVVLPRGFLASAPVLPPKPLEWPAEMWSDFSTSGLAPPASDTLTLINLLDVSDLNLPPRLQQ